MNGWVITKDHLFDPKWELPSREGYGQIDSATVVDEGNMIFGRRISVETDINPAEITDPVKFRLYDDDMELYYSGVITEEWLNGTEEYETLAFAPLNFAEADAGCTIMDYYEDGVWKTL
jgi:hypothetical protein